MTNKIVKFNLQDEEYIHFVMGWCRFIIRPYVKPYTNMEMFDKFKISNNKNYYYCKVSNISLFDKLEEVITEQNYTTICYNTMHLSFKQAKNLAALRVYNSKYKDYYKENGKLPKIMLMEFRLFEDPKL